MGKDNKDTAKFQAFPNEMAFMEETGVGAIDHTRMGKPHLGLGSLANVLTSVVGEHVPGHFGIRIKPHEDPT